MSEKPKPKYVIAMRFGEPMVWSRETDDIDIEGACDELNTLAAENARLREALERVAKCQVGAGYSFKEERDRLCSIASDALK